MNAKRVDCSNKRRLSVSFTSNGLQTEDPVGHRFFRGVWFSKVLQVNTVGRTKPLSLPVTRCLTLQPQYGVPRTWRPTTPNLILSPDEGNRTSLRSFEIWRVGKKMVAKMGNVQNISQNGSVYCWWLWGRYVWTWTQNLVCTALFISRNPDKIRTG